MTDEEFPGEDEGVEEEAEDEELLFIQQEIMECFSLFDPKNKGKIPIRMLGKALKSLGLNLTNFEVEDLSEKYYKDGFIEYPDFQQVATERLRQMEPTQVLKQAFKVFDPDSEGVLPTDRLRKWMTTLGNPLTDAEAKELCRMGDPANKGVFVYGDAIPLLLY